MHSDPRSNRKSSDLLQAAGKAARQVLCPAKKNYRIRFTLFLSTELVHKIKCESKEQVDGQ
jgi:hypothetical protein